MSMASLALRVPEPEYMTEEEEYSYAQAVYSVPHEALAKEIVTTVARAEVHALDIGCGPGDVLCVCASMRPAGRSSGRIYPRMLGLARMRRRQGWHPRSAASTGCLAMVAIWHSPTISSR